MTTIILITWIIVALLIGIKVGRFIKDKNTPSPYDSLNYLSMLENMLEKEQYKNKK